ncbi:sulfotransferase domain protein [Synechococcus sp. A15-62]|uniref:tetratricopeptide repeat protein n=1 Tax=Synechococcus sp. A15-62 TaxID=1050657 RepID=UPI001645BAFB|nr:sulfotransferase [Synechococcus sp. A15-62]QNI99017.1 sulfotransferase domain protein [Synechococcus sp. A15-62]
MNIQDTEHRALNHESNGDLESALMLWEKLSSEKPHKWQYFVSRFRCLISINNIPSLLGAIDEAKSYFPNNTNVIKYLADLLCRSGHFKKAESQYIDLLSLESSDWTYEKLCKNDNYRKTIFNLRGIYDASKILPITNLSQDNESTIIDKHFIFVSGLPRAGTTALGSLLRVLLREKLYIFTELTNPYQASCPDSFNPINIQKKLTQMNLINARIKAQGMKTNSPGIPLDDKAIAGYPFIGDKRPMLHYAIPHMQKNFSNSKVDIFHILRDPIDALHSCTKRAENMKDSWDPLRSYEQCSHEYNVMNNFLDEYFNTSQNSANFTVHLIDYNQVFRSRSYIQEKILRKLGLANDLVDHADSFLKKSASFLEGRNLIPRQDILSAYERIIDRSKENAVAQFLE